MSIGKPGCEAAFRDEAVHSAFKALELLGEILRKGEYSIPARSPVRKASQTLRVDVVQEVINCGIQDTIGNANAEVVLALATEY